MPALGYAVEFDIGEVQGSWDTTLSYGQAYRTGGRDWDLIGIANGGSAFSVNLADGDLNYDSRIRHLIWRSAMNRHQWRQIRQTSNTARDRSPR